MGKRQNRLKVHDLGRLLVYVLGNRPDEFALVPDRDGFLPIKELLRAIHEEAGWSHVRRAHINEVLMGADRNRFELKEDRIRAVKRDWFMEEEIPPTAVPKVLFAPIRRKAHPVVLEKGLTPHQDRSLVLSPDRDTARRIGMRRDPEPVLIEVMGASARAEGIPIAVFGQLYLSAYVPPRFISGPPVPKDLLEKTQQKKTEPDRGKAKGLEVAPGSFVLDMAHPMDPRHRVKGRKPKGWKEAARKTRGRKRR